MKADSVRLRLAFAALPVLAWLASGCAPPPPSGVIYRGPTLYGGYAAPYAYGGAAGYAHGAYGGTAVWNNGAGYAHGAGGGTAAWNNGAGYARGADGGTAVWNHGAGYATGPRGTVAWRR